MAGQGIALVPYGTASQDILAGLLRTIRRRGAPFVGGYRLLVNPHKEGRPKGAQFRAWTVEEMEAMRNTLDAQAP